MKTDDTQNLGKGEFLLRHVERFFGEASQHWKDERLGLTVSKYLDQPCRAASTYVTMGLSKHPLEANSGGQIEQELLFSCWSKYEFWRPEDFLFLACQEILSRHHAFEIGDVLGPAGPIHRGSSLEGFYCAWPTFFPDEFHVCRWKDTPVSFGWLIPITKEECMLVKRKGGDCLENIFEKRDPDLLDLQRPGACQLL